MDITLSITSDHAVSLLDGLLEDEAAAKELLERLQANIRAIESALNPVEHQVVMSSSGTHSYDVTKTIVPGYPAGSGVSYTCTCQSFQYARGLDDRSRCKHIRTAISYPFGWSR